MREILQNFRDFETVRKLRECERYFKTLENEGWLPSLFSYTINCIYYAKLPEGSLDLSLVAVIVIKALPRLQDEIRDFDWKAPESVTSHPLCRNCIQFGSLPGSLPFVLMLFVYLLLPFLLPDLHLNSRHISVKDEPLYILLP
jgi:hypothetical protein